MFGDSKRPPVMPRDYRTTNAIKKAHEAPGLILTQKRFLNRGKAIPAFNGSHKKRVAPITLPKTPWSDNNDT